MAVRSRPQLCAATHCALPGRHAPGCPTAAGQRGPRCRGCLPAVAADGLRLCAHCTDRLGEDARRAAQLYADLVYALIRRRRGEVSGSSTGAPVPDDDVMDARAEIRAVLLGLAEKVAARRGIYGPHERYVHRLPEGMYGPAEIRTRRTENLPVVADWLHVHRQWMAAHPAAADVARALRDAAGNRRAYALAYASGTDRLYIGQCPLLVRVEDEHGIPAEQPCDTRLYQHPDLALILCAGCGAEDTVEQWRRWIVPVAGGHVDVYAAAADLAMMWLRPVDPALLRQWAARGRVSPVMEPDPAYPARERPARDGRGRTLYPLDALREYARSIWGDAAGSRRAH